MTPKKYSLSEILESLDIPHEQKYQDKQSISSDEFVSSVHHFVTEKAAQQLWAEWNPDLSKKIENPTFLNAFQEILAESASLGYRLSRFKEISKKLPEPRESRRNWVPFFEEAIHDCEIRVYLNYDEFNHWIGAERSNKKFEQNFKQKIEKMADELFKELGLAFPLIDFIVDESLVSPYFRVEWNDFKLPAQKGLPEDKILVDDTVDRLTLLNIKGEEAQNPANGSKNAIVPSEYKEIIEQAGLISWDPDDYLILSLRGKITRNAAAFVNRSFVDFLICHLTQSFPATIEQINKNFDRDLLVRIIRGLLAEEISIRNLHRILDSLLSLQSTVYVDLSKFIVFSISGGIIVSQNSNLDDIKVNDYLEMVRNHLKRYISHKYTRGGNTLVVYLMNPTAESRLKQYQKLSDTELKALLDAIHNEIGDLPPTAQNSVILTTMEIRHRLRMAIRVEFPHLAVLSYQELSPDLNIQPIARISPELSPLNESFNR